MSNDDAVTPTELDRDEWDTAAQWHPRPVPTHDRDALIQQVAARYRSEGVRMAELVAILIVDDIILPALTAAREIGRMSGYGQGYMAGLDKGTVERAAQAAREHHERVERMAERQQARWSSVSGLDGIVAGAVATGGRVICTYPPRTGPEPFAATDGDVAGHMEGRAS
ncbi:hypothetical protein [Occultella gossypii]|uniref:Uncharacterized protein n=1 Tax=Occultella gossypii TaxID=2800820 RepID=A0ABS7SDA9_9MICO|nr:hypothetical protein [Occultella gossypii]MBZ2197243.1 hypothetical protein [Occultella gossypii]